MAEQVSRFAQEAILPKARAMDEAEAMDPTVVEQLFEQGLMGIEVPEAYGGAGMGFTAAIVAIEELARVDPSVSILVDVHNTLVNSALLRFGSEEAKRRWLPKLATESVGVYSFFFFFFFFFFRIHLLCYFVASRLKHLQIYLPDSLWTISNP